MPDIKDHKPGTLTQTKLITPEQAREMPFDAGGISLRRATRIHDGRLQAFYQMIWSFIVTDEPEAVVLEFERVVGERGPKFLHDALIEAKRRS